MLAGGAGQPAGVLGLGDAGLFVEDLDDPLGAGAGGVDRVPQVAEAADRPVELGEVGDEDQQPAQGDPVVGQFPHRDAHHQQHADGLEQAAERGEQRFEFGGGHLGPEAAQVLLVEPVHLVVFAVVGLDQRDVAQGLLGDRGDRTRAAAPFPGGVLDAPGEHPGQQQEARCGDERGQRQLPVQVEHGDGVEGDLERVGQGHVHAGQDQRLDRSDITGQAGQDVTELVFLEVPQRQPLHVREQPDPQVQHETLADPRRHVLVGEVPQPLEQR